MHESEKWKWSRSVVRLLATTWTTAYEGPSSMGFSRQEYWSGVPWNTNHSSTSERIKPTDLCIFGTMLFFFFSKNLLKSHGSKESYFNEAKESSPCLWSAMIWACNSKQYETWGLVHPAPSNSDDAQAYMAVVDANEAKSHMGNDYKLRGKKQPKQREDGQRLVTT